jgi:hypothetical protein
MRRKSAGKQGFARPGGCKDFAGGEFSEVVSAGGRAIDRREFGSGTPRWRLAYVERVLDRIQDLFLTE